MKIDQHKLEETDEFDDLDSNDEDSEDGGGFPSFRDNNNGGGGPSYSKNKGNNYPIILSTLLQSIYIAKFFYWETGYFNTLDITLDKGGWRGWQVGVMILY